MYDRSKPILHMGQFAAPAAATPQTLSNFPEGATEWRSIDFGFVTDANAANRRLRIDVTDGTQVVTIARGQFVQTALTTVSYSIAVGLIDSGSLATQIMIKGLPDGIVLGFGPTSGQEFIIDFDDMQAGDQIGITDAIAWGFISDRIV